MGWAFLPPIQRQLAEPIRPLSRGFEPGAWASPMFTGSMTHAVADGAPHGLIDGDGRGLGLPVQRTAAGPELTLLPPPRPRVQRSIQRATDEELAEHDDASSETREPEARSTGESATGDGPDEGGAGGDGGTETPLTISRAAESRLPVAVPEPPRSLVRASPAGLPFVQRSAVAVPASTPGPSSGSSSESASGSSATPPASLTPVAPDRPAADSPVSARPPEVTETGPILPDTAALAPGSPAPEPLGAAVAPSPVPGAPAGLPVQRMSSSAAAPAAGRAVAGERPRLGFGPPLEQVPSTAQSSPPPDVPGPALQAQRAAADGFTEVTLPGVAVAAPKQPPAPGMPLQRASSPDASPMAAPAVQDESSPAAADEAVHPDDCADPGHGHPAAALPAAAIAGPPDVVPTLQTVVPEPPVSPMMRGEVAPLNVGGLSTSIQRSSVLPGLGLPVQKLSVRPAGLPAAPSSRVVRVQRVPSSMSSQASSAGPSTSPTSTPFSAQSPGPSAAVGTATPPPTPMGATHAATSPTPTSTPTPMGVTTSIPALQRSTTPGAPASSLPVVEPVGHEGLLDAGAAAVAVEYSAVPLESGSGMSRAGSGWTGPSTAGSSPAGFIELGSSTPVSSDLGSGVAVSNDLGSGTTGYGGSNGAGPASFVQRSSAGVASAPALRATGVPSAPPLVLPQRASAAEVEAVESATIQRAEAPEVPEPEPAPPPAEAADAGSPAAAPPAAAPPAAGGQQSPEQAEAMARQLFPSLLRMLRGELIVDRERRGVRTDRW
ncbi:hypothetical protein ASD81_21485 [Nocardioides sp. Root614]|nr:hypothetical protein ASD81_21485 [Nocardioides sp. Root614]KRA88277.1 hypothetical protein ASD84_20130 [Nocardioides sp. Root682]